MALFYKCDRCKCEWPKNEEDMKPIAGWELCGNCEEALDVWVLAGVPKIQRMPRVWPKIKAVALAHNKVTVARLVSVGVPERAAQEALGYHGRHGNLSRVALGEYQLTEQGMTRR